jgi:hypothetical protein
VGFLTVNRQPLFVFVALYLYGDGHSVLMKREKMNYTLNDKQQKYFDDMSFSIGRTMEETVDGSIDMLQTVMPTISKEVMSGRVMLRKIKELCETRKDVIPNTYIYIVQEISKIIKENKKI